MKRSSMQRWGGSDPLPPLALVAAYGIVGVLWILGTDRLALLLFPNTYPEIQSIKELIFIAITALLLYGLLKMDHQRIRSAMKEREAKEEELAGLLDHLPQGVLLLSPQGVILKANRMALEILGKRKEELLGLPLHHLPFGDPVATPLNSPLTDLLSVVQDSPIRTEFVSRYLHPQGTLTLLLRSQRIDSKDRDPRVLLLIEDITTPFKLERKPRKAHSLSPLTGLPDREMFLHYLVLSLHHARYHQRAVGVVWIDLDRFYEINQMLGREKGNAMLQEVATRFRNALRDTDILAHIGGDKFLVLVPDLPLGDGESSPEETKVVEVGERIRKALAPPFQFSDTTVTLTASLGISIYPTHHNEGEMLLQYAETACQIAKREKVGGIRVFSPEFLEDHTHDFTLRQRLSLALERGEFVLYFQPIVDLKTTEWYGAEALLRWCPKEGGVRTASEFLPFILSHGDITALEEWIIKEVVRTLSSWAERKIPLKLSFNIAVPFQTEGLLIEGILSLPTSLRSQLIIELTENVLMTSPLQGYRLVENLSSLGTAMALDDFGTGYSSLQRLKELPILYLKIDRMFVRNLPQETDLAILQAILGLGKSLGKQIIAEGIERNEQWYHLRDRHCPLGQGYIFGPPLPEAEFLELYEHHLSQRSR